MKIHDITVTISAATPIYKGDPGVEFTSFKSIAGGSSANVSQIGFGVHTATHVDRRTILSTGRGVCTRSTHTNWSARAA